VEAVKARRHNKEVKRLGLAAAVALEEAWWHGLPLRRRCRCLYVEELLIMVMVMATIYRMLEDELLNG